MKSGRTSQYRHPSPREWSQVRRLLLERSLSSNPLLDPELTAYTPGETLNLIRQPQVQEWHKRMKRIKVPDWVETIVFVPCAKTKPWGTATRGLYASYNRIRALRDKGLVPPIYFVSISEPLGVVPEELWDSFPQYDNPGLFRDDAQRSGILTSEWPSLDFKEKLILPFDEEAYREATQSLGSILAKFIDNHSDKEFVSFIDQTGGSRSSHEDMLDFAETQLTEPIDLSRRYPRRQKARTPPEKWILSIVATANH